MFRQTKVHPWVGSVRRCYIQLQKPDCSDRQRSPSALERVVRGILEVLPHPTFKSERLLACFRPVWVRTMRGPLSSFPAFWVRGSERDKENGTSQ
jgi:hypothetical protein